MIFLQDMAEDNLSLEKWSRTAVRVGPTELRNGETNFHAFTECLDLVPSSVVSMLNDKSNWSNRLSAANDIERILKQPSTAISDVNLKAIVSLISTSISDTQSKVSQKGMQLMQQLIVTIGKRITPYVPTLTQKVVVKMGSNKADLKRTGMQLFRLLVEAVGPMKVVNEITTCGLRYKTSRVREEAINVIISVLILFQGRGIQQLAVAKELVVCMTDGKAKVRQAAFEAIALITSRLVDSELAQVVAMIGSLHKERESQQHGDHYDVNLMDAYHARLERHSLPTLDEDGLVQYSIMPLGSPVENAVHTGADVDWIMAASGHTPTHRHTQSQQLESSPQGSQVQGSTFRPYRSAGKRPWETEKNEFINISPIPPQLVLEHPSTSFYSPKFQLSNSNNSSSKKLPGNSYMDIHLSKMGRNNPNASSYMPDPVATSTAHYRNSTIGAVQHSTDTSIFTPTSFVSKAPATSRYNSMPPPPPSTLGDVGGMYMAHPKASDESLGQLSMTWPRANLALASPPSGKNSTGLGPVMSNRTPGSSGLGLSTMPPLCLKGQSPISTDTVVIDGQSSASRPLSKPRVRNPLSSLKPPLGRGRGLTQNSSSIPSVGSNTSQVDGMQVEQDFLTSGGNSDSSPPHWAENSFDEEYFSLIPEDNTLLNCSLSSSLSSLKDLDGDGDKFKRIHQEAASRKAQLLSTATSATSSPETYRLSNNSLSPATSSILSDTVKGDLSPVKMSPPFQDATAQQEKKQPLSLVHLKSKPPPPPAKKWNTLDSHGNNTQKEEKTYSQVFAKKILHIPPKTFKPGTQARREKGSVQCPSVSSSEEVDTSVITISDISLEGHGLDCEGRGLSKDKEVRKKSKKGELHQSKNRPSINGFFGSQDSAERRPTIERGGTNTITMEVSGIGSRNSMEGQMSSVVQHLSQNTRESMLRKKQKHNIGVDDVDSTDKKSLSATYPNTTTKVSQVPLPALNHQAEDIGATIASAPVETTHKRNKRKKNNDQLLSPHKNHNSKYALSEMDLGRESSPQELDLGLLETHVLANPDQAVKTALESLASQDWNIKCEGLGMVICIVRRIPHQLQPHLHTVLVALQKEVKNLRSSVSKKAVECLTVLFTLLKKVMELDLDKVVQALLHKSGEANVFLRETVEKCLLEMTVNVSPQRSLVALVSGGANHRNPQVRRITSKYICIAVNIFEPSKLLHSNKDVLEKVLPAIVHLTKDNSPDTRYYGRKCFHSLWLEPEFNHVANRVLKDHLYTEAKEVIEILKVKGVGEPPSESKSQSSGPSSTTSSRHPTGGSTRVSMLASSLKDSLQDLTLNAHSPPDSLSTEASASSRKSRKQRSHTKEPVIPPPQDVPLPDGLLERLQANGWNERYEAIGELEDYVVTARPQVMSSQLQRIFDAFTSRLTDRNSKVNLHALQVFCIMVPVLHSVLIPIIHNILGTLIPNLASRNLTIHSTAMSVLDLLCKHIDAVYLLPTVANSSQFGNARIQPIMTKILADLCTSAYTQKPQQVNRLVLPVVWHHVSARTPLTGEAKIALCELCKVISKCMGQSFLDNASHLSVSDYKKLTDILEWDGTSR